MRVLFKTVLVLTGVVVLSAWSLFSPPPQLLDGYFPLGQDNRLEEPYSRGQITDTFKVKSFEKSNSMDLAGGYSVLYQQVAHFHETDMKLTFHLVATEDQVVSSGFDIEEDGHKGYEEEKRILLMLPKHGAHGVLTGQYPFRGGKMHYRFYYGKVKSDLARYPDCLVADEEWTDDGDRHHTRTYYQKGIGVVRTEQIRADGSVMEDAAEELITQRIDPLDFGK